MQWGFKKNLLVKILITFMSNNGSFTLEQISNLKAKRTMKAYMLRKSGPSHSLKIEEVPEPIPGSDEVKVKVRSIGINYAEILSRRGQYNWAPKRPYVPGMEAFGEVVEVGSDVDKLRVGDKVLVGGQYGAYAEYLVSKKHLVFPAEDSFSPAENAAYLVSFMTAYVALVKLGRIQANEKVLVQAAAGGVGTSAVQIAKAIGAEVYGTASQDDKLKLLADLGVDHPINYKTSDFLQYIKKNGGGVDAVLEVVGGEVYQKSLKSLNTFGRLVVVGYASIPFKKWNPISWYQTWKNAPKVNIMDQARRSSGVLATHIGYLTENPTIAYHAWNELKEFVIKHNIKPVVGKTFDFANLPEAHDWVESRNNIGKTVVLL
jgi:NADPH:quinone reductase-like Zn-dependent oxidoreductase